MFLMWGKAELESHGTITRVSAFSAYEWRADDTISICRAKTPESQSIHKTSTKPLNCEIIDSLAFAHLTKFRRKKFADVH
jgi:hypothetical protein